MAKEKEFPAEDVLVLEAAKERFAEIGLIFDYEQSYSFGEGSYDVGFENGGRKIQEMQLGWMNADKTTEEWAGFDEIEEWDAHWTMYDDRGVPLIENDGATTDIEVIVEALQNMMGNDKFYDISTVNGLHAFLTKMINDGKKDYKIYDHKYQLFGAQYFNTRDKDKEVTIDCRLSEDPIYD